MGYNAKDWNAINVNGIINKENCQIQQNYYSTMRIRSSGKQWDIELINRVLDSVATF